MLFALTKSRILNSVRLLERLRRKDEKSSHLRLCNFNETLSVETSRSPVAQYRTGGETAEDKAKTSVESGLPALWLLEQRPGIKQPTRSSFF